MLELLFYHLPLLGVALLLAHSLNMVWRTGLFSLGHHGFFAIGAYTAVIVIRLLEGAGLGTGETWPGLRGVLAILVALAAAAVVTGITAYALVHFFRGLSSDYFAVGTLVFAEVIRLLVSNWDYVGAARGANLPNLVYTRNLGEIWKFYSLYCVGTGVLVFGLYGLLRRIDRSVFGLFISAISDDRLAARVAGVSVTTVERCVFTGSCAVAGVAGVISAFYSTSVVPSDYDFVSSMPIILYVVLGARTTKGCLIATTSVYFTYEAAKLRLFGLMGGEIGEMVAQSKEIVFALTLIAAIYISAAKSRHLARPKSEQEKEVFDAGSE